MCVLTFIESTLIWIEFGSSSCSSHSRGTHVGYDLSHSTTIVTKNTSQDISVEKGKFMCCVGRRMETWLVKVKNPVDRRLPHLLMITRP